MLDRLGYIADDPDRSDNSVDWKLSFAAKPKKNIVSFTLYLRTDDLVGVNQVLDEHLIERAGSYDRTCLSCYFYAV